jgi:hypothetical protein
MAFPSIRSQVSSAEPANTTSHTINYPATIVAGDTLLCLVASDGDNTFDWASADSSKGWVKIGEVSSSDSQTCLSVAWVEADGTEDSGSFELSSTENEESCARMFCIQDAADPDTSPPVVSFLDSSVGNTQVTFEQVIAGIEVDYQKERTAGRNVGDTTSTERYAIQLDGDGETATHAVVGLTKVGSPTDNVELKVFTDNGGEPSTTQVGGTASLDASTLTTAWENHTLEFATSVTLAAATTYWLVISRSGSVDGSNFFAAETGTDITGEVSFVYDDSVWTATVYDLVFRLFSEEPTAKDFLWFIGVAYDDDDGGMTTNFPPLYQANSQYDISGTGAGTSSLDTSYRDNDAVLEQRVAGGGGLTFGSAARERIAIQLIPSVDVTIDDITAQLGKIGSPTDNLEFRVYTDNSGEPSTTQVGGTASKAGTSLTTTLTPYRLTFGSQVSLTASTTYWLVATRSGSLDGSNNYITGWSSAIPDEVSMEYASSAWSATTSDQYYALQGTPTIFFNEDPSNGTAATAEEWVNVVVAVFPVSGAGATPQALPATAIGVATMTRKVKKNFVVTATATPSFTRKVSKTLAVTAVASPALNKKMFVELAATAVGTAVLTTKRIFKRTLAATAIGVASFTRTTKKNLVATAVGSASFQKKISKTLAATAIGSATLLKKVSKTLAATAVGVAGLSTLKVIQVVLAATAVGVAGVARTVKKNLTATAVGSATLSTKALYKRTLAATAVGVATLNKKMFVTLEATAVGVAGLAKLVVVQVVLAATAIGVPTMTKKVSKTLAVTATAVPTMVKTVSKTLAATATGVAGMVKKVSKTLAVTATAIPTLTPVTGLQQALEATAIGVANMTKKVSKTLAATAVGVATLVHDYEGPGAGVVRSIRRGISLLTRI